jgi:hypothetical protein
VSSIEHEDHELDDLLKLLSEDQKYRQRYVAFVDILGWSELMEQLERSPALVDFLHQLLSTVHKKPKGSRRWRGGLKSQSISDAVAISADISNDGLRILFNSLQDLALSLLEKGYFVRGAVVRGRIYQDERVVFGKGLVEAYRLESQIAKYPRILVTRDVADDMRRFSTKHQYWQEQFDKRLEQADDGPWFLHVLRDMERSAAEFRKRTPDGDGETDDLLRKYSTIRSQIERRLEESRDTPRHFEKVQWYARYWNASVHQQFKGFPFIDGPGLNYVRWVRS